MAFAGWPEEAIEFYEGLEADNSKTYWQQHKHIYEDAVRAPMEALLAELAPKFGDGKIFRPYRDVRFSRDKSPYKTAIGATLSGGGYVQLSSSGLSAGAGMYHMASDQLQRYRDAVVTDASGKKVSGLIEALAGKGIEVTAHDSLRTAPRGYPKDHERIDLLRLKGLIGWKEWPVGRWLGTAKAKDHVIGFLADMRPLLKWLDTNVGQSNLPAGR
jgi:uncharacterized protein (TIGR02453 family)